MIFGLLFTAKAQRRKGSQGIFAKLNALAPLRLNFLKKQVSRTKSQIPNNRTQNQLSINCILKFDSHSLVIAICFLEF